MRLVDTQTIDGDVLHLTYERSRNAMRAAVASIAVAASLSLLVPACVIDGTTTRSPDVVSMPNVLGLNYCEARRELESMCFVVEIRLYNARSVTKQQATPGQEVEARGRKIAAEIAAVAVGQHHVEDDHRGGTGSQVLARRRRCRLPSLRTPHARGARRAARRSPARPRRQGCGFPWLEHASWARERHGRGGAWLAGPSAHTQVMPISGSMGHRRAPRRTRFHGVLTESWAAV